MAKKAFESVEEYVAAQPAPANRILKKVRSAIRKALPEAEESLSYGIPTYKADGRAVIYFAGWREHYSIYPSGAALVAAFAKELKPYDVEKGTIRFPWSEPVPVALIDRIARFRLGETRTAGAARKRTTKAPKKS